MEIQDRNNLLQQLFMTRAESTPIVELTDQGFADMLKPQKPDEVAFEEASKPSVEFKREDYVKTDSSFDNKQDILVKDNKEDLQKDNVADKKAASDDNVKNNQDKSKVEEDKSAESTSKQEDKQSSQVQDADKADKSSETSENIAASEQTSQNSSETNVVSTDNTAIAEAQAVMASAQSVLDVVSAEEMVLPVDEATPLENIAMEDMQDMDVKIPSNIDDADTVVNSKEDILLAEQAKYIDKKIASSDKIKIDVNVAEDKVEAPMLKDVLQNRFEVDQLVKQVDSSDTIIQDDLNPEIILNKDTAAQTNKNSADLAFDISSYKGFSSAEVQAAKDVISRPATDASNLAVSGKEVVFETSNNLRAETFSRLNESSQRDAFKGIGKEVVEQIKVNITKSAIKGVDTIDIQLKPEDLGKIQIKMHIAKDGKLHADIISSRPETMDMLQKDVSSLQKAFSDAGYDTDSRSFNFSFQKENQSRDGQDDASGLMQFIGDALEQEAKEAAGNDNLEYDPILGLNIRV